MSNAPDLTVLHHPAIDTFDANIPADFLQDILRMLDQSYRDAHAYCSEHFAEQEAHDLLGYHRRAVIEQGLRTVARRHGLAANAASNKADNCFHTRVEAARVLLVECCVQSRLAVVRRAEFRNAYAEDNQLVLLDDRKKTDPASSLFAILLHGCDTRFPDRVAFADIAFPNAACDGYVNHVDLMFRFPELARDIVPSFRGDDPVANQKELNGAPAPRLRPNVTTTDVPDQG